MSTCEIPSPGSPSVATPPPSRVLRFVPASSGDAAHGWVGVAATAYKAAADHHHGVSRTSLIGDNGERTAFHVRYFEIAPGGNTTLEYHQHEHVVVVLRGRGVVQLGDGEQQLALGDTVYVAPYEPHQFRNPEAGEPFGFLCLVDAVRDRPVVLDGPG